MVPVRLFLEIVGAVKGQVVSGMLGDVACRWMMRNKLETLNECFNSISDLRRTIRHEQSDERLCGLSGTFWNVPCFSAKARILFDVIRCLVVVSSGLRIYFLTRNTHHQGISQKSGKFGENDTFEYIHTDQGCNIAIKTPSLYKLTRHWLGSLPNAIDLGKGAFFASPIISETKRRSETAEAAFESSL